MRKRDFIHLNVQRVGGEKIVFSSFWSYSTCMYWATAQYFYGSNTSTELQNLTKRFTDICTY